MLHFLARATGRIRRWLGRKSPVWQPVSSVSDYAMRRSGGPGPADLLAELKNAVFTCASINAAACAAFPPRLYVATYADGPEPRCARRKLDRSTEKSLRSRVGLPARMKHAATLEEVTDHPLLTLLRQVNPVHNAFDLWELTTFYQETIGSAYWLLDFDPLGIPRAIWVLPSQHVTPRREAGSPRIVDYYEHRQGATLARFEPREIIHFRYPDPNDPYTTGLSPLRGCWEQAALTSDYLNFKQATWQNCAMPGVVVSPNDMIGEEERDRLEKQWNNKFQGDGAGRVLVTNSNMKVSVLTHNMGDLAALAEYGKTKEDIANAFHVPLSFLTSDTNLANLQAAEHQHLAKAIVPRIRRRDEKLNEQLVPLFDPSGRLFLASDDPIPINQEMNFRQQQIDLKYGLVSINEMRQDRGLPPVSWGDTPWLPVAWAPTDFPKRTDHAPGTGRAKEPRRASRQ